MRAVAANVWQVRWHAAAAGQHSLSLVLLPAPRRRDLVAGEGIAAWPWSVGDRRWARRGQSGGGRPDLQTHLPLRPCRDASALSWLLFLVIVLITAIQLRGQRRWVDPCLSPSVLCEAGSVGTSVPGGDRGRDDHAVSVPVDRVTSTTPDSNLNNGPSLVVKDPTLDAYRTLLAILPTWQCSSPAPSASVSPGALQLQQRIHLRPGCPETAAPSTSPTPRTVAPSDTDGPQQSRMLRMITRPASDAVPATDGPRCMPPRPPKSAWSALG